MIDEKGRLFGKINIVDLLVILVVIIAAAVLGVKFLKPGGGSAIGSGSSGTHVSYTVLVENVHLSESLMQLSYNITRYEKEHPRSE